MFRLQEGQQPACRHLYFLLSSLCFQENRSRLHAGQKARFYGSCETRLSAFLNRSMTASNGYSSLNRGKENIFLLGFSDLAEVRAIFPRCEIDSIILQKVISIFFVISKSLHDVIVYAKYLALKRINVHKHAW